MIIHVSLISPSCATKMTPFNPTKIMKHGVTHLNARIKVFHSDRGSEYLGKEFIMYLKLKGTVQKLTVHDTPQHNSVAERRNRTIVERVHALLHSSGLPKTF